MQQTQQACFNFSIQCSNERHRHAKSIAKGRTHRYLYNFGNLKDGMFVNVIIKNDKSDYSPYNVHSDIYPEIMVGFYNKNLNLERKSLRRWDDMKTMLYKMATTMGDNPVQNLKHIKEFRLTSDNIADQEFMALFKLKHG